MAGPLSAGVSADELIDLQRVADAEGVSLEQAINDYAWQDDFAILATELEEKYPDEFAGAEIVDASRREAMIAFRGRVPADAVARAEEFRLARIRLVGERGHSVRELDERLETVHLAISRRRDLVGDVSSTYDLETGVITVEVEPRDAARAAEPRGTSALISELKRGLPAQAQEWVATIAVTQGLNNRPEAVYGGGRIELSGSGDLHCSGGFTVRNSYGTTGIATAGHCPDNSNTYENYSGGPEMTMYWAGGRTGGSYGDFQWHTVNGAEVDDFYYDKGMARDVAAIANPAKDQRICRYGQVHRAACADVQDLSACATWEQGGRTYEACRLVRTDNDISDGGDSGGPWYWGTTAFGIHWGTFDTWLGDRSAFSRVTYIDEAIGVQILR